MQWMSIHKIQKLENQKRFGNWHHYLQRIRWLNGYIYHIEGPHDTFLI